MRISVIGLGKLGSPIVASFASRGHNVIGVDVNPAAVEAMNYHRAFVNENGLQEMIDANRARISATMDLEKAVLDTDASFVIVPTPSEASGGFTNKYVVNAAEKIGAALKKKSSYHLVVIVSTMLPGSSKNEIIPALERASGKIAGKDFGYAYNATLLAIGTVIRDFLSPELIMNGAIDVRSGDALDEIYNATLLSKAAYHRVTPTEAELAKIAINTYITNKISFANMIGMIADAMPDVDVNNVTNILGTDSRIGHKYLKAGGSYGGPCFPRDNRAFSYSAGLYGVKTFIPQATDATNQQYIQHLATKVRLALANKPAGSTVGIVGVAYKPNTDVVEEGMGLFLADHLAKQGLPVVIFDPSAAEPAKKVLGNSVKHADSLEACLAASHVVVITNPYREQFADIDPMRMDGKSFIDCWGVLQNQKFEANIELIPVTLLS